MSHRDSIVLRVVEIPLPESLNVRVLDVMAPQLATHDPCFCGYKQSPSTTFLTFVTWRFRFAPSLVALLPFLMLS
jgi:hypothetical protein